jgi:hypothetical protein
MAPIWHSAAFEIMTVEILSIRSLESLDVKRKTVETS